MDTIDNLLNPYQAINNHQEQLLEFYINEYGIKYADIIKQRLEQVKYFFDSRPDITYTRLKELGVDAKKSKNLKHIYLKYLNYILLEHHFSSIYIDHCMKSLSKLANIPYKSIFSQPNCPEIIDLDFQSFSEETEKQLQNTQNNELRRKILERKKDYLERCEKLKIDPITDPKIIEQYLIEKETHLIVYQNNIIRNTTYGNEVIDYIKTNLKDSNMKLNQKQILELARIFCFKERIASNFIVKNNRKQIHDFIILPLFENVTSGIIDLALLHELYHAIESTYVNTGIKFNEELRMLNEFRTELKAKAQFQKMRHDNTRIFDTTTLKSIRPPSYDRYIFLSKEFLEKYKSIFDYSAINSDISILYEFFGKENILEYGKTLNKLYKTSKEYELARREVDQKSLLYQEEKL